MRRPSYPTQVNGQTCGIAALAVVAARCEAGVGTGGHQVAAVSAGAGSRAGVGEYLCAPRDLVVRAQLGLHERAAKTGLPWPRALGTAPWALAQLAEAATGATYRTYPWVLSGEGLAAAALDRAIDAGDDAFLYVGGGTLEAGVRSACSSLGVSSACGVVSASFGRLVRCVDVIPRHVIAVLARESTPEVYALFEPSSGEIYKVSRDELIDPDLKPRPSLGNWTRIIFGVIPQPSKEKK